VVYRSLVAPARNALARLGRALAPLGAVAVAAVVLHLLGVAGYQAGEILVAIVLAVVAGGTAWRAYRPFASRGTWTAAVAVGASALTGVLTPPAPWSTGRLGAELDAVELPFAEVISERTSGHSWCIPTCPVLERTYRGPAITPRAAAAEVAVALVDAGLGPEEIPRQLADAFTFTGEDVRIVVRAEPEDDELPSPILITIRLEARR